MTTAASTIAPMAMAIPPKDMMLALTPCQFMTVKAARMPSGRLTMATNADRKWNRNRAQTRVTTMNSSISRSRSVATER